MNSDMFFEYSELLHLNINYDKTKNMIFGTRCDQHFYFHLGGHQIVTCTDFKYLGVIFSKNRHFYQARKHNIEQAKKAMHALYKQIRNSNIPIDCIYIFLTVSFCQYHYTVVRSGALKIAKLSKIS